MLCSVVIPTMAGREELLRKLLSTIPAQYEVIVVDDEDLLLAAKRNKGAMKATGEYFFFIDDDNYLAPGAIEAALRLVEKYGVGVVGFVACYDNKKDLIADGGSTRNFFTGFTKGINTNASIWSIHTPYEVDEVANAFMMHSETFFELQGFDEKNFPIDLDEADLCKRIKNKNLKILMVPLARCYHKSQTYSPIPDFRRPLNAYTMGRNKLFYNRKHLNKPIYMVYLFLFLWSTIAAYFFSLVCIRRKPKIFIFFMWGILDGIFKPLMSSLPDKVYKKI